MGAFQYLATSLHQLTEEGNKDAFCTNLPLGIRLTETGLAAQLSQRDRSIGVNAAKVAGVATPNI